MKRLVTYHAIAQHTGTWLRGYRWNIYGCGTYRQPEGETRAQALMKRFIERLERKMHGPVWYFAALERRHSGCGDSPIPVHWHFLAASADGNGMRSLAESIWTEKFGNAKIEAYDENGQAAYYVSKLVSHHNGMILSNLDAMEYRGPTDLLTIAATDPYIPTHLRDKVFGRYLAVR